MEDNGQEKDPNLQELADALPANGTGSEEAVAAVTAADAAADAPAEEERPAPQPAAKSLPAPRCPYCQVALFTDKSGVTTYNIQMGPERIRIFTCANCDCVLPMQVMMIDTPMIAAPGQQGGRLIKM
jgi:hypothetical protein